MDIWLLGLWIQYRVTQEGLLLLLLLLLSLLLGIVDGGKMTAGSGA
jgi:hypothetical protein